jgi:hypothetical protein
VWGNIPLFFGKITANVGMSSYGAFSDALIVWSTASGFKDVGATGDSDVFRRPGGAY